MMSEPTPAIPYETGVIHGRFQVLHNDHLNYLLSAKALCRHLVVGITNPDPYMVREETADPHRSSASANPLTYFERYLMVKAVLLEQGIGMQVFSIVPLPINLPERYQYYVPLDAVFFLSIYDHWGERKRAYFKNLGLSIHILRKVSPQEKGISASEIRRRMVEGLPWEDQVPKAAAHLLRQWRIPERLKRLLSI